MGGGGGGGSTSFKAQGTPPNFDYQSAQGLQNMAIGGDIQSYALSDQDFANRYPALQQAYNTYQANLNPAINTVAQGQAGQGQIMQGLAGTILGRQQTPTTSDITNVQKAAATAAGAVQPIMNLGGQQAGLAQPILNLGGQQAGIGAGINQMGGQLAGAAQIPYQLGQQLLTQPITPQTQQQMMLAGLGTSAGALGAASLGQGMAGQAAAARQLGLNTVQYGQAMRGEAMQDIGQYSSMLGQAGQLRGLGASTLGGAGQTTALGGAQLGAGAQTLGLGANVAGQAGGLSAQAQQLGEQYAMDTAQMGGIYSTMQQQQNAALLGNISNAAQMFQKRPFGLGGTNMAQAELGQAGSFNSFQQANYATMNGIAFNQAQINSQNQQLQQNQQAGLVTAGIGAGTTAATTGAMIAAMSAGCWVARALYGTTSNRWKIFRHWLVNKAPGRLRQIYLRHGEAFARHTVRSNASLSFCLRLIFDLVIARTAYVCTTP